MNTATTYYQTNLETDITYLKGVGPQRGYALKKFGIQSVGQLLYQFPRKYLQFPRKYRAFGNKVYSINQKISLTSNPNF